MTLAELEHRFWARVALCEHGHTCCRCCWLWQGGRTVQGYGTFLVDGVLVLAHRFVLELVHGALVLSAPKNGRVKASFRFLSLHTCDTPPCVNWHHLYLGTVHDNAQDRIRRHRHRPRSRSRPRAAPMPSGVSLDEIGARIARVRRERHLSQVALAHRCGFHAQTMTAIEAGRRNLSLHQLGVLARVLRVSLPYLLGEPLPPGQFAHETYAGLPPFSQP